MRKLIFLSETLWSSSHVGNNDPGVGVMTEVGKDTYFVRNFRTGKDSEGGLEMSAALKLKEAWAEEAGHVDRGVTCNSPQAILREEEVGTVVTEFTGVIWPHSSKPVPLSELRSVVETEWERYKKELEGYLQVLGV